MKFDKASTVQDICWTMRRIEMIRSENRAVLQRQFNGDPPFDERTAEENGVEINRNFLKGVQVLADARRQWNQAFLSSARYFNIRCDYGPVHMRDKWSTIITDEINKYLKKSRAMFEMTRATGANVILHGIAPCSWRDKNNPIPAVMPLDSVLIPTETEIDFENLSRFAVFRQFTPSQLHALINKPKNPGWNKPLATELLRRRTADQYKDLGNYASWSPEKFEEVLKQDAGFWDSDAVPTIDVLDFYFREEEDGNGWYRRIILDWDTANTEQLTKERPGRGWNTKGEADPDNNFLYNSGTRPYCDSLSEILHCQFGDCSAYAPFKYHSVRSLGWLLWGVCDLMNRLECRFYESVFENLMWFFRASGENDLNRIRKAVFQHMGVIPNGINFVSAGDRFTPNPNLIEQARSALRTNIAETAASYTHDFDKGETGRELTATETMARVNSINSLLAGMMTLAYTYEESKYLEQCKRIMRSDMNACAKVREAIKKRGVPAAALDTERWIVQAERVIGAGNKTIEMAAVTFLQSIRKNLPAASQRKIDNLSISSVTDKPDLADDLAPLDQTMDISNSTVEAEQASARILRGLPFTITPKMIPEDFVVVWLKDLAITVQQAIATNGVDAELINGVKNLAQYTGEFLQQMSQNEDNRQDVAGYLKALGQIMQHVKVLEQQFVKQQLEKQQAGGDNGNGEAAAIMAKTQAQIQADAAKTQQKLEAQSQSHAQRAAQREVQFQMEQTRKDKETAASIARESAKTEQELRALEIETAANVAAGHAEHRQAMEAKTIQTAADIAAAQATQENQPSSE